MLGSRLARRLVAVQPLRALQTATFAGFPLHPRLLAAVQHIGCAKPLPIQESAMRRVYAGESLAIHSETGSGKTLAYMLPLLARLKPWPPRQVLLVVPTYALALQNLEVGRLLTGAGVDPLDGVSIGRMEILEARRNTTQALLDSDKVCRRRDKPPTGPAHRRTPPAAARWCRRSRVCNSGRHSSS